VQLRSAARSGLHYHPNVLSDIPRGSLVLLRGPRRVGKSVEIKRLVQQLLTQGHPPRAVIHAAADGWTTSDLRTLVNIGKRLAPPTINHRWWLIDEVSSVPQWSQTLKYLRDNDPDFAEDTVILTGSSSADLTAASSNLAGRRGPVSYPDRTLLPMGFRTFADIALASRGQTMPGVAHLRPTTLRDPGQRQVLAGLLPWLPDLLAWWEIYLQCGGFPQSVAAQLTGGDGGPIVQALFDIVQRDAFGSAGLSQAQSLGLLASITANLTNAMNLSDLARDLDLGHDTASRRLADLNDTYLTWTCHRSEQLRPNLRAQAKRYFTDPLLARLAHLRNPTFLPPDATQLTEQQLGIALVRSAERNSPGRYADDDSVLFERTPSRKEIDFVGPQLDPVAIEAKYIDDGRWVGEAATVNASRYQGIIATRSVLDTESDDPARSWAVPACLLAYCLDT
jgi:uncharacterized protein